MRKGLLFLVILVFVHKHISAQLVKSNDGITLKNIKSDAHTLQIKVLTNNIIRISASPTDTFSEKNCLINNKVDIKPDFSLVAGSNAITIKTCSINIIIDPLNGRVTFKDKENNSLLLEYKRSYKPVNKLINNLWSVRQEFKWSFDEELYGFVKDITQKQCVKGCKFDFSGDNSKDNFPLILSSKGYGVVWDIKSQSSFSDLSSTGFITSDVAEQINYYFIYGPSSDEILLKYRELTGNKATNTEYALLKEKKLGEDTSGSDSKQPNKL